MDKGRIRVGLSMIGSFIRASHTVDPGQQEPGVAAQRQPAEHELSIGAMEWSLDAQVGLHERFAIEILLPIRATIIDATFNDAAGDELEGFQSIHHRDETISGVGDLVLSGRIALVLPKNVPRWTLFVRAGMSQPTGGIEPDPFIEGEGGHRHQHMFFGSGTYDPVLGLDTNVAFDRWSLVAWTTTRAALYANRFGYRGSTVVAGGAGAQSRFGLKRWAFLVQPEVYFETPAVWSGAEAKNSGRLSLIATAGVFATPAEGWQLYALAKIPYYTATRGGQLRWPVVGVLGFARWFDLGGHAH
ncbi:MAG: hypothetical protein JKY37_11875 [Nannocystaceae bacterium]|nr:hypothetical protein [Nannocystaceae bacterium]